MPLKLSIEMNLWYNACFKVRTINFAADLFYIIPSFFVYKKEKEHNQIYMFYIILSFFLYKKGKEQYNQIYMVNCRTSMRRPI
jgi:hypothetical protein